jgi:uncharacterized protein
MIDVIPFLADIASQYRLDPTHTHGLSHWARVLENGLKLAEHEGGDTTVICLFAIFHDACRHNQTLDPGHGTRGAKLAETMLKGHPQVTDHQLKLLTQACREHTSGKTLAELTVKICWDADRLDLARAGIKPNPRRLCTHTAKNKEIIHWANERSVADYSPAFVDEKWMPFFIK